MSLTGPTLPTDVAGEIELYRPAPAAAEYEPGAAGVSRLVAGWLLAQRSQNTADAYRRDITAWLEWLNQWATPPLDVRRDHADAWARWMEATPQGRLKRPLSKASINRRLASVASFYDYCVGEEVIEVNRVKRVKRHRVDKRHSTTFRPSAEEALRILDEARAAGPRTWALSALLMFTGARVSEVLGLAIADLGTDMGVRTMRVKRKGGTFEYLPFKPAELVGGAVDDYLAHRAQLAGAKVSELHGPLFLDRGGLALSRQAAARDIKEIGTKAGCPRLTPHSLRHTFATIGTLAGAKKDDLQVWLGHSDSATTDRYVQRADGYDTHPGDLIANFLAGLK